MAPSNHRRKLQAANSPPSTLSASNELDPFPYDVVRPLSASTYQPVASAAGQYQPVAAGQYQPVAAGQYQLGGDKLPQPYPSDWPQIDRLDNYAKCR